MFKVQYKIHLKLITELIRVMPPHVMKCHYEVLEVERNTDDATLKKQYRKLALKVVFFRKRVPHKMTICI